MTKKLENIRKTIVELHRALKALQELEREASKEQHFHNITPTLRGKAKRASMDATRALAEFRKTGNYE